MPAKVNPVEIATSINCTPSLRGQFCSSQVIFNAKQPVLSRLHLLNLALTVYLKLPEFFV